MKSKLKTTYLITVCFFILVTVGSMILFYNIFSEDYVITKNRENMQQVFEDMKSMNIKKFSKSEKKILREYSDKGGLILVYNGEKITYYSGDVQEKKSGFKSKFKNLNKFVSEPKSQVSRNRKAIRLRGKIEQDGQTYYIFLNMKLKTLENIISIMSQFMLTCMIVILCLGIPFSFYMAQRTVRPIEKLNSMSKLMEENKPINFEEYIFPSNEIGDLAEQLKRMYIKISNNINELANYNYLLKTQNKELIEFDERRKRFIANATHELKTPLAIISTQLEMMNLDNNLAKSEYYESIMEEIQKMSNLIREMLNSSFEGDIVLSGEMKRESLTGLLNRMKEKYKGLFWSKKANCVFDIEDDVYIDMNVEQIEQAVNNYIINAYEHISERGMALVKLVTVDDKVIISVYNDGNNVEEEQLDRIWNRFYQGKEGAMESNVGLGLYIVKNIVKNHNGQCYAKNYEKGIEFVMEFDYDNQTEALCGKI